jgi:hypothetical protein
MNKMLSLVFVGIGVVLLVYGISASNSIASDFSRLFTDAPTDKSIWLLAGGLVSVAIGLGGLIRRPRSA